MKNLFNAFRPRPITYTTPPASILSGAGDSHIAPCDTHSGMVSALLADCGVPCVPVHTTVGAQVIQHHFNLVRLSDYSKLKRVTLAISARLQRSIILERSACADFALAVTRSERETVHFRNVLLTRTFNDLRSPTVAVLGSDTSGNTLALDVADMPHLLIAGATGSGKTVCLHTIIGSLLFKATPAKLKLLMIDPKQIELTMYNGLPHLLQPVITSVDVAISALGNMCQIMDDRYRQMNRGKSDFPRIVIVIDELADLMMTSRKAVEPAIVRLAQLGRAAGIHLIVATQRPTVNVVTGLIKANMPARIALTMASYRDAGVMEVSGADKLAGRGDALFQGPDHTRQATRFQVAYISTDDTLAIVNYWRSDYARR